MRARPDNTKEGFKGYATQEQFSEYEDGESHLVLHDTLGCHDLRGIETITVWADNISPTMTRPVYLHARCVNE